MRLGIVVLALAMGVSGLAHSRSEAEKLIRDLQSRDARTRSSAAWDLGQIGAVEAVPALTAALQDEARSVRANAATSLGRLADHAQSAIPALRQALDDPYGPVVANAASSLRKMGVSREELAPAYRRLLFAEDCGVRLRAVGGLSGIADASELVQPSFECTLVPDIDIVLDAGKRLRALIDDRSQAPAVIDLLERAGDVRVVDLLLALSGYQPVVSEGIPAVMRYLDSADAENRGMAAIALGRMGAAEAAERLATLMLSDPDPGARERAAQALGDIGPDAAVTVPQLIEAAEDERWPSVREAAIGALGDMGTAAAAARPTLYAALDNREGFIRIAARNALFRVDPDNKDEVVRRADAAEAAPPAGGASDRLFEDVSGLPDALAGKTPNLVELNIYEDFAIVVAPESSSPSGWGRFTYRDGILGGPEQGSASCQKTFAIAEADLELVPRLVSDAIERAGGAAEVVVVTLSRGVFCKKPGWMLALQGGNQANQVFYRLDGRFDKSM